MADLMKGILSPLRDAATPRRGGMMDYLSARVLPTLLPALKGLSRVAEASDPQLKAARDGADAAGMPFDQRSTALKVYIARNVTPALSKGLEACFRETPDDAVDFLASFLFERSGDDGPGDEKDEEALNPLHWLGQYEAVWAGAAGV